jgi:hypothetical protein
MRWFVLLVILLFIAVQITRMRPSKRDQQLRDLRKVAAHAGLTVHFWTLRNSGYSNRHLPESGFVYCLPAQPNTPPLSKWALWINKNGEMLALAGTPPDLAKQWLVSFREQFPDAWALLDSTNAGISLLWEERGQPEGVQNIADALDLLRKNLDAIPG